MTVVIRQNVSRDQRRGGLGRVVPNTIIAAIQHEDSGGEERECAWMSTFQHSELLPDHEILQY